MQSVCLSCRLPFDSNETHSLLWPCKHSIHEICAETLKNCLICHTPIEGLGLVTIKRIDPNSEAAAQKTNSLFGTFFEAVKHFVAEPSTEDDLNWTVEEVVNNVTHFVQVAKQEGLQKIQVRFIGYLEAELLNEVKKIFTNTGFEPTRSKETEFTIAKKFLNDGEFQMGVMKYSKTEGEHPVFGISFGDCDVTLVFASVQYNP